MSNDFRVQLLEQKVEVMQKEVSQVLNEMQTTIQAIAQTYSVALKVLMERADKVEKHVGMSNVPAQKKEETNDGVEL